MADTIHAETVTYSAGDTTLRGYLASDTKRATISRSTSGPPWNQRRIHGIAAVASNGGSRNQ